MKYKIAISFLSFIYVTVLYILASSLCHVAQTESCFIINLTLLILMICLMCVSALFLVD